MSQIFSIVAWGLQPLSPNSPFLIPQLLSEAVMHECILRLLRSSSDGESLECFAKLMSTIGKEMDHDKIKVHMQRIINGIVSSCVRHVHFLRRT